MIIERQLELYRIIDDSRFIKLSFLIKITLWLKKDNFKNHKATYADFQNIFDLNISQLWRKRLVLILNSIENNWK